MWRKLYRIIPLFFVTLPVYADLTNESLRIQQQQQALETRLMERAFVANFDTPPPINTVLTENESPCFPIHHLSLRGKDRNVFNFLIPSLIKKAQFHSGMCLGQENIRMLYRIAQNLLIEQGFITSLIELETQDLNSGELILTVYSGYLNEIKFRENRHSLTDWGRRSSFPIKSGDILNLRAIEQGLENLRYLSSSDTKIEIPPSYTAQQSDIVVYRHQHRQLFGSVGIDNLGSVMNGKYQGNADISIHSLFGFNDLFYAAYTQDLGHHKVKLQDNYGNKTKSGSKGYSLHYSLPIGYWLWRINHSRNQYHDATEGAFVNYDYSGISTQSHISLARTLFRDQQQKWTITSRLWRNKTSKYLNGNEIEVQRRKTAGWQLDLQHQWHLGFLNLDTQLHYKRGIGFKSLPAPEEFGDEDVIRGKSRMKIWQLDLHTDVPFSVFGNPFSFQQFLQFQWHKTQLVPQDKLALGTPYTIRAFSGKETLQAERGWLVQNTLNWHIQPKQRLYLGWDYGRVSGDTAQLYPKRQLSGLIFGLNGRWKAIDYELALTQPLLRPTYFTMNKDLVRFSARYHF
jgi:hemolysin activation/secretion protein